MRSPKLAVYVARSLAVAVGLVAFMGLFVEDAHIWAVFNVDLPLDLTRIGLAAVLIYGGFMARTVRGVRYSLAVAGAVYMVIGLLSIVSGTFFGLLPHGQVPIGIVLQLIAGAICLLTFRATYQATDAGLPYPDESGDPDTQSA